MTPQRQPVLAGHRRPVGVQTPAHPQLGEGQESGEGGAGERGHRADLHEAHLAHDAARAPPRLRPRGVRVQAVGGLRDLQREAVTQEQEAVEEAVGKLDVVVDHEQPVAGVGWMGREQAVEVLELSQPAGRTGVQLHIVARAQQLRTHPFGEAAALRALDAEREHAPQGRTAARREAQTQAPAARQLPGVHQLVLRAPAQRVEAPDGPTRPREEVIAVRVHAPLRCSQALPQATGAVRDHRQPGRAAAADDVSETTGEREQLAAERGRLPAAAVEAAGGAPARVGGASQGGESRVRARSTVVNRGAGDVQDTGAVRVTARAGRAVAGRCGEQAILPLLLVSAMLEREVERADTLQGASANGHVGAPCIRVPRCPSHRGPAR